VPLPFEMAPLGYTPARPLGLSKEPLADSSHCAAIDPDRSPAWSVCWCE
jgi:hypothetical protein